MDTVVGIANAANTMKTLHLQSETTFRVMKMVMDLSEQEGAGLIKMLDAAMTGIGQNIDMFA